MGSDAIKTELTRLHPDTKPSDWKRRSRTRTAQGVVRAFEHEDGRLIETVEAADGTVTARAVPNLRGDLDKAIADAFRKPLMDKEGYDSWRDMMDDYRFENAGAVFASSLVVCAGPTPDRFYEHVDYGDHKGERLYDNLHGVMEPVYVEHEGRGAYEMHVDRSGYSPRIRVFATNGAFDYEIIADSYD